MRICITNTLSPRAFLSNLVWISRTVGELHMTMNHFSDPESPAAAGSIAASMPGM